MRRFLTDVDIDGLLSAQNIPHEATDVDKFLVSNAGEVRYRTGSEVLSDIGGAPMQSGTAAGQMTFWNGSVWAHTETSELFWDDTAKSLHIGNVTSSAVFSVSRSAADYRAISIKDDSSETFFIDAKFAGSGVTGNWLELGDIWGNTVMTWRNAKVGILNNNPLAALHVSETHTVPTQEWSYTPAEAYNMKLFSTDHGAGDVSWHFTEEVGGYGTFNVLSFRMGRVGVSEITPLAALHINGGVGSLATGLVFGDGDSGIYENTDDVFYFAFGGNARWSMDTNFFASLDAYSGRILRTAGSSTVPSFTFSSDQITGMGRASASNLSLITGGVEAIRIDASQNVGIGVVPTTWRTEEVALQIGGKGAFKTTIATTAGSEFSMLNNAYEDAISSKRISNDEVSKYRQANGYHEFQTAAAGIADSTITWTSIMKLHASGNVSIGNTNDTHRLEVTGTAYITSKLSVNNAYNGQALNVGGNIYTINGNNWVTDNYGFVSAQATTTGLYPSSTTGLSLRIVGVSKLSIDLSGNVTLGTIATSTSDSLLVETSGVIQKRALSEIISGDLDSVYLRLDTANDPLTSTLEINNGGLNLTDSDVAHGMTAAGWGADTDSYGYIQTNSTTDGGLWLMGMSDADATGLHLQGVIGSNIPTDTTAAFLFRAGRRDAGGTSWTSLSATDTAYQFKNYSTTLLTILGSGNVGIGTVSPTELLHINGGSVLINSAQKYAMGSTSTGSWISREGTNRLALSAGGTEAVSILESNQYVGIGGGNPLRRLHVSDTSSNSVMRITHNIAGGQPQLEWANNSGRIGYVQASATIMDIYSDAGAIRFAPNSVEAVRIIVGGNVGIGTVTPAANLHIVTADDVSDILILEVAGTSAGGPYITFQYNEGGSAPSETGDLLGGIRFRTAYASGTYSGYGAAITSIAANAPSVSQSPAELLFWTTPQASTTLVERMRIDEAGLVGIGVGNPLAVLHVYNAGSNQVAAITGITNPYVTIGTGSNVGGFVRWNTSTSTTQLGNHTFSGGGGISIDTSGNTTVNVIATGTSDSILIENAGVIEKRDLSTLFVEGYWTRNSGSGYLYPTTLTDKVGIGTGTPLQQLHVTDKIAIGPNSDYTIAASGSDLEVRHNAIASGVVDLKHHNALKLSLNTGPEHGGQVQFWVGRYEEYLNYARSSLVISLGHGQSGANTDADTDVMTLLSSGNVGIGTTSPGYKLEVAGTGSTDVPAIAVTGFGGEIAAILGDESNNAENTVGRLSLQDNGVEKIYLTSRSGIANWFNNGGNVGIGTTTPTLGKLQVNGDIYGEQEITAEWSLRSLQGIVHAGLYGGSNTNSILNMFVTGSFYNWSVQANGTVDGAFTITPSTGLSGNIFTTPALSIIGSTSNVLIGTTTDNGARFQVYESSDVNTVATFQCKGNNADIALLDDSTSSISHVAVRASGDHIKLVAGGAERFMATSAGVINIAVAPADAGASDEVLRITSGGDIVASSVAELIGDVGYWDRTGTTLTTANAGDNVVLGDALTVNSTTNSAIRYGTTDGYYNFMTSIQNRKANAWTLSRLGTDADASDDTVTADLLTVLYTGNVGIGTTAPGAKLHVYKGASGGTAFSESNLIIEDSDANILQFLTPNNTVSGIMFGDPEATASGYIRYSHVDDSMRFHTAASEKLTILTSGNVGIGTTSPTLGILQVAGSSGIFVRSTGVDGTYQDILSSYYSGNNVEQNSIQSSVSSIDGSSGFQFQISDGGGLSTQTLGYRLTKAYHQFYSTGALRYQIDSSGNHDFQSGNMTTDGSMGIGTSSTITPLVINRTLTDTHWDAITISNYGSWSAATGKHANIVFTDSTGSNHTIAAIGATYEGVGRIDFHSFYNSGYGTDAAIVMSLTPSGIALGTGSRVNTIETTLTDDDTHLPTSGAVYAAINTENIWDYDASYVFLNATHASKDVFALSITTGWSASANYGHISMPYGTRATEGLVIETVFGGYPITFKDASGTNLFIEYGGNVGIGTTTPSAVLEVFAGSDATTDTILWGETIRNNGNSSSSGYGAGLKFKISNDAEPNEVNKWVGIAGIADTAYANAQALVFYTSSNSTGDAIENMRISGSGVVTVTDLIGSGTRMVVASSTGVLSTQAITVGTVTGTGTDNYVPLWNGTTALDNSIIQQVTTSHLNIGGGIKLFDDWVLENVGGTGTTLLIGESFTNTRLFGNVGVGKSNPATPLEVVGETRISYATASGGILQLRSLTGGGSEIQMNAYSGTPGLQLLRSGNAVALSITNAGLVGLSNYATVSVDTIETTLTDDDTHLPTSGAVYDAIATAVGVENLWDRTGTVLTTANAGDKVIIGNATTATNWLTINNTTGAEDTYGDGLRITRFTGSDDYHTWITMNAAYGGPRIIVKGGVTSHGSFNVQSYNGTDLLDRYAIDTSGNHDFQSGTAAFGNTVTVTQASATYAVSIDQNGNATALNIDSTSADSSAVQINAKLGMLITQSVGGGRGLYVQRNIASSENLPLVTFYSANAATQQSTVLITHNGTAGATGYGLEVVSSSTAAEAITVTSKYGQIIRQNAGGGYGLWVTRNIASSESYALAHFINDNVTDTQATLLLRNDGSGAHITTGATNENLIIDPNGTGVLHVKNHILLEANSGISVNTADGSDTGALYLSGGGGNPSGGQARGAFIRLYGNEAGTPGEVSIYGKTIELRAATGAETTRLSIATNGAITFNSAYTFPTADGTSGQVLVTNGADTLSWTTISNSTHTHTLQQVTDAGNTTSNYIGIGNTAWGLNLSDNVPVRFGSSGDYSMGYNSSDDKFYICDGALFTSARYTLDASGNHDFQSGTATFNGDVIIGNGSTPDLYFNEGDSQIYGPLNANFVIESRGNDAAEGITLKGADGYGIHINKSGNVGFRTTTPSAHLHVSTTRKTVLGSVAHSGLSICYDNTSSIGDVSQITLGYRSTYGSSYIAAIQMSATSLAYSDLTFGTRDVTTDTAPTERMRITGAGNVGIGTNAPTQLFEVSGGTQIKSNGVVYLGYTDATASGGYKLEVSGKLHIGGDSYFAGNVGIGLTAPQSMLEVRGSGGSFITVSTVDSGNNGGVYAGRSYADAEEHISLIGYGNNATISNVNIGGGNGSFNAATGLYFYTAANNITLTGTLRYSIDASGNHDFQSGTATFGNDVIINNSSDAILRFQEATSDRGLIYSDASSNIFRFESVASSIDINVLSSLNVNFGGGTVTVNNLSGSGTRMVVASSTGILSTQAITIGTVTGTGTDNRIAVWSGTTSLDSDADLTWDGLTLRAYNGTSEDTVQFTKANSGSALLVQGQSAGVTDVMRIQQISGTWGNSGKNMLVFKNIEAASTAWNFIQGYNDPNESGDYDNLAFEIDGTGNFYTVGTGSFGGHLYANSRLYVYDTVYLYNGTKSNTIVGGTSTGNAWLKIQGGNYTHSLQLFDSYNSLAYASINGGFTDEAYIKLSKYSSVDVLSATSTYAASYATIAGLVTATSGKFTTGAGAGKVFIDSAGDGLGVWTTAPWSTTVGTVTSVATSGAITGGTITSSGTISHLTSAGYKHIPTGGSSTQILQYSASGTAVWYTPPWTTNTGTVTSVAMTVPTGLTIGGSPITTSGTLALTLTAGYSIPTTVKQGQWDTAYGWGNHAGLYANLSHTHGNITNAGYIGATANLVIVTGTAGILTAKTAGTTSQYLRGDGSWATPAGTYSLPLAADGTRGGVQIGYVENGKNYPVELSTEKMFVNIPWTDTVYTHPNHSGHVSSVADGATTLLVAAITGQTELASGLASTDELLVSDAGVIKRMDVSVVQTYMQNNLTFTTNTNWYPTAFSWSAGTTAGPTGSLTGTGMSAVSYAAIPSASNLASGIVTTAAQTFAGVKTFAGIISTTARFTTGASNGYIAVSDASGNLTWTAPPAAYSLPLAANGTRGGIQIGYTPLGANLALQLSSEKAYIALTKSAIETVLTGAITSHTHAYGTGTVTSVAAGNGMDFTTITGAGSVTMGTPSTLTSATTNAVTATSHTHAVTGLVNINNNADNRVITGSDTANTLEGEQYLTWNSSTFALNSGNETSGYSSNVRLFTHIPTGAGTGSILYLESEGSGTGRVIESGQALGAIYFMGKDAAATYLTGGYISMRAASNWGTGTHPSYMNINVDAAAFDIYTNYFHFNASSGDVDFRIDGDGVNNLFYVDASEDSAGIKINSPKSSWHVNSNQSWKSNIIDGNEDYEGIPVAGIENTFGDQTVVYVDSISAAKAYYFLPEPATDRVYFVTVSATRAITLYPQGSGVDINGSVSLAMPANSSWFIHLKTTTRWIAVQIA